MKFDLEAEEGAARAGTFVTPHGNISTPVFMPVGTAGTVKAIHSSELERDFQVQIVLSNAYHLYLRPGIEVLKSAGGLHRFMKWNSPILTDSGGFQVYSLGRSRKVTPEGVSFRSHWDGSKHFFTPQYAVDIQRSIGADIIMAFDECVPYPCEHAYASESLDRTHNWLDRCRDRFNRTKSLYGYTQSLFPIIQGSIYEDLRIRSAERIASGEWDGFAIGGLSVGEPPSLLYAITEKVCRIFPTGRPRYLMGIGTPENILEAISLGVDMFDCVLPTRNGRNGMLFTTQGTINIRNQRWVNDHGLLDPILSNRPGRAYSKAYLRHLVSSGEILGAQIATGQNIAFYTWLMATAREKILKKEFQLWKKSILPRITRRL